MTQPEEKSKSPKKMPCPTDPKCNDPLRVLPPHTPQINPKRPNAPDSSFTIPPYHFDTPQAYVCMTKPEEKSKSPKKNALPYWYRFHLVDGFRTQFHFRTEYSVLDTKIWFTNENAILEPKSPIFGSKKGIFVCKPNFRV